MSLGKSERREEVRRLEGLVDKHRKEMEALEPSLKRARRDLCQATTYTEIATAADFEAGHARHAKAREVLDPIEEKYEEASAQRAAALRQLSFLRLADKVEAKKSGVLVNAGEEAAPLGR